MIDLYAASTPNGRKATIVLEETGLDYNLHKLELSAGDHRRPEFLRINPNGKIPVIVDTEVDATISESGAILIHLAEKAGRLLPAEPPRRTEVLQWLCFQIGGVGPMAGQYEHFRNHKPRLDYAYERYRNEVLRLLGVMDGVLSDRPYIAGDYSIADIALTPWMRAVQRWDIPLDQFAHISDWYDRVMGRPAVQRGFAVLEAA